MRVIIMAAGKGTRLAPLTDHTPKPLVEVAGRGTLLRTLDALPEEITSIVLIVGYLGEKIRAAVGEQWNGRPVVYVEQTELNGTGGALMAAKNWVQGKTLVLNGDDLYSPTDLRQMMENELSVLAVRRSTPVKEPMIVEGGAWKGFGRPQDLPAPHYLNCGAYVLDERYFSVPMVGFDNRGATEYGLPHTMAQLAEKGETITVVEATFWMPVGTHEELQAAEAVLTKI